ncbi:MAG: amidohydrolase [Acidobacteriota bacterium]
MGKINFYFIFAIFIIVFLTMNLKISSQEERMVADLALTNGNVITMDCKIPLAQAIAIKGERILFVGSNFDIRAYIGKQTKIIDLEGKTIIPGLIDSHVHFIGLGERLRSLNFVGTKSIDEIVEIIKKNLNKYKPGEWILGGGWDHEDWEKKEFPTHGEISEVAPDNPVYLTRVDGHAGWANKRAMEIAKITREIKDPAGGKIIRDSYGNPTGVFIDEAQDLITRHIPERSFEWRKESAKVAQQKCLELGLTGVHDAGVSEETIKIYKELADENLLKIRIYAMLGGEKVLEKYLKTGPEIALYNNKLSIRSVKLFIDGALGSKGAALFEPYNDDPGNYGLLMTSEEKLFEITKKAVENGFQVCVHAIGDKGNHITLNVYEKVLKEINGKDCRLRIEHAQVLLLSDIPRFSILKVIPSMQPTHATSDMYWAEKRLGEKRAKGAYAWRSLLRTGARIAAGSDFPVEDPNPLWGFYAAITRQDHNEWPRGGWHPEEKMTREEALRAFTIDAAYASFEEDIKGSLEKGKLADVVVLSKDIMLIPPEEILKTEVIMTIIGGEIVYSRN